MPSSHRACVDRTRGERWTAHGSRCANAGLAGERGTTGLEARVCALPTHTASGQTSVCRWRERAGPVATLTGERIGELRIRRIHR
jgi:hypothetical protein